MGEKPILFSAPMVRAILEGRKTMTRRIVKGANHAPGMCFDRIDDQNVAHFSYAHGGLLCQAQLSYAPGDLLWAREAFIPDAPIDDDAWDDAPLSGTEWAGCGRPVADVPPKFRSPAYVIFKADPEWDKHQDWKWRPSIHMPRWASRITLRVTAVKVERLQDISDNDAEAEGATDRPNCHGFLDRYDGWSMDWSRVGQPSKFATGWDGKEPKPLQERDISLSDPRLAFASYWISLHGPGSWDANPWVAAYSFERVKP